MKTVFRTTAEPTLFKVEDHRPKNGMTFEVRLYQKGLKSEEIWPAKPALITIYPSEAIERHGIWGKFIKNWNKCSRSIRVYVARINTLEVPKELVIKYISFEENSIRMYSKGGYEITFQVVSADSKKGPTKTLLVSIRI